jgi:DNA-binding response OmpR family regulator
MENVNKKNTLVEDDLILRSFKDYLMLNDFDVTLAKNGMEGFEKFKRIRMICVFLM